MGSDNLPITSFLSLLNSQLHFIPQTQVGFWQMDYVPTIKSPFSFIPYSPLLSPFLFPSSLSLSFPHLIFFLSSSSSSLFLLLCISTADNIGIHDVEALLSGPLTASVEWVLLPQKVFLLPLFPQKRGRCKRSLLWYVTGNLGFICYSTLWLLSW